jgi:hypothetical protein
MSGSRLERSKQFDKGGERVRERERMSQNCREVHLSVSGETPVERIRDILGCRMKLDVTE